MMMLNGTELKASTVLQAMVEGLLKSKDDPKFTVEMGTFGHVKNQLCYGCAATLTLTEMFGDGRPASEIMLSYAKTPINPLEYVEARLSDVLPLNPSSTQDSLPTYELCDLERAIDDVRTGEVSSLIYFLTGRYDEPFDGRWKLGDENWEEQIPEIERTIAEMIAAGY